MRIGIPLQYSGDIKDAARQVAELEKVGLDTAWVAEAYGFDAATSLGYLAAGTQRVRLGAGILPVYTRTPALIAQTAAGLDHLSDGRAVLGLGASGPQVIEGWHAVPYERPLTRTRETVEICRKIWAREAPVTHQGRAYTLPLPPEHGTGLGKPLKIINHPRRARIPVYLAALGPKNVALAAEIADGWLPFLFLPEKAQEVWGRPLADGRAKRAPELGPLEVSAGGMLALGEGEETSALLDLARPLVALYVGGMGAKDKNFYATLARNYGYGAEAERIQELYLSGRKDEAAAAVPRELLELTNLVGPESYVRERIAAFREAGVTELLVTPLGDDPVRLVERIKGWL